MELEVDIELELTKSLGEVNVELSQVFHRPNSLHFESKQLIYWLSKNVGLFAGAVMELFLDLAAVKALQRLGFVAVNGGEVG